MNAVDLARWQFAITTVYHFLFVPVTIGLSAVVAWYHGRWVRHHRAADLRLAKFLGKLLTINFALGLVTGIVQEFQFGMNWSDYSRFVGDVFGAPLAIEALLAFFLESTFLGLWIFGWGKLPERLHAATMWVVHIGTLLSAYFILAANSFMQHPVGYRFNPTTGRAEMTDFLAVLTNKVQLVTFPHTVLAAYMVGGAVVMGVSVWAMMHREVPSFPAEDRTIYRQAARVGAVLTLVAGLGVAVSGDLQGKIMTEVQPMKMASAEGLYTSAASNAPFSLLTIGSLDGQSERLSVTVPGLLSFLATGNVNGAVQGINELKSEYVQEYAATGNPLVYDASYTPTIPLTYWAFRLMIGVGLLAAAAAALLLFATRRGRVLSPQSRRSRRWWTTLALAVPLLPIFGNSFGWIFTEAGRQPWLVFGLMSTSTGVSPGVSAGEVLTSMIVFTALYGVLAVVEIRLFLHYVRLGAPVFEEPAAMPADDSKPLVFAY